MTGDGKILINRGIGLKNRVELRLQLSLVVGRRAFRDEEKAADHATIAGR